METKSNTISNKYLRILAIICAWFFLLLGVLGILLPVIPTAVLIFVSAGLFAKSSPRLYNWLINTKLLGKYVIRFHQQRNIPFSIKFISIIFINLSIGYTVIFVTHNIILRMLLLLFAFSVTIYILSIRSKVISSDILTIE
ncbi:MAG: YbaN family protein [Bacteroidota bacterium]|nr:YbaN family protein [Bacteroidota bacterium]MDP4192498.1 YbaN family protein [Bacteroidota bacterium]MDP4194911.1 YbaN family protein [Bacteroidota bacterium]